MNTIREDLAVVQAISEQLGLPLLETLIYIGDNMDAFNDAELTSYTMVRAEFQKLFA